ncbi:MAG: hypothetical protein F4X57_04215 [Chloroflexi bacterium]|nr:hypothetical protein [Chloroflexota bacterium]
MWMALGLTSFLVVLAALVGAIVGLVIGIARKRWKVLKWSAAACGISLLLLIVAVALDGGFDDSGDARASNPSMPVRSFEELKADAQTISYRELFRNSEQYEGQSFYFRGEVVQVVEKGRDKYDLRIRLGDIFDDEVVYLSGYEGQRLLEDDIIEFVGESIGLLTYEATFGNRITIPQLKALSVRLVSGG